MAKLGYSQILIIKEYFTQLAETTCDHLITHRTSRYRCPMTFQSDNGKAFVGDLIIELIKRSHIAQAHTNGLVERQSRTLVIMLGVCCSIYVTGRISICRM